MEEKKTVRMDEEQAAQLPGEDEPTVLAQGDQPAAAPSPFVRTATPGSDRPTPRIGQPAQGDWGVGQRSPQPQPPAHRNAFGQQGPGPRGEAATVLISQRPTPVFAWLVVMDGPDKGRIHPLQPDTTTVGRLPNNDVTLPDDAVSGQHLKIRIDPQEEQEDQFLLIDLASSNGTYVGARATYRNSDSRVYRHVLQDGDYLLLGETTLVFKRV